MQDFAEMLWFPATQVCTTNLQYQLLLSLGTVLSHLVANEGSVKRHETHCNVFVFLWGNLHESTGCHYRAWGY